jgi:hypothetical protein
LPELATEQQYKLQ